MNNKKGITLIALVITIVILIILATVTVNSIFGEDGLIKSAQEGANRYNESAVLEETKLSIADKYVKYIIDNQGSTSFLTYLSEKCVGNNAIITSSGKTVTVESKTGKITYDGTTDYNMYAQESGDVIIGDTTGDTVDRPILVWSDEFEGTELDMNTWSYRDTPADNNEEETWVDTNAEVSDGTLKIIAKYDETNGYTSSEIWTLGKKTMDLSTPGRVEASIALPEASSESGVWPAFWMMGTAPFKDLDVGQHPICGEIDVFEGINSLDTVYATVHGPKKTLYKETSYDIGNMSSTDFMGFLTEAGLLDIYNKILSGEMDLDEILTSVGGNTRMINKTDFHTYAVEWKKNDEGHTILYFYYDENMYFSLDLEETYGELAEFFVSPNYEWYAILNVSVGGNWPGNSTSSEYPLAMEVDYVRYYKLPE